MKAYRVGLRLVLTFLAALFASCIDGHEEYWLDDRGGGRAEAVYQIPASIARMHGGKDGIRALLEDFLRDTPGLHSTSCDVAEEDGRIRIRVRAAFDSAESLKDISSSDAMKRLPSSASRISGEVKAEVHGRTLEFRRTISAMRAIPGSAFLPTSTFEGHSLTYVMHLPAPACESDATRTEDGGHTLVWEFPLGKAVAAPVTTSFTMKVPIPWSTVGAVAIPLVVLGGFAWVRLKSAANPGTPRG